MTEQEVWRLLSWMIGDECEYQTDTDTWVPVVIQSVDLENHEARVIPVTDTPYGDMWHLMNINESIPVTNIHQLRLKREVPMSDIDAWDVLTSLLGKVCEYRNDNDAWVPVGVLRVDTNAKTVNVVPHGTTSFGKAWHIAHPAMETDTHPSLIVTDITRIRLIDATPSYAPEGETSGNTTSNHSL